MYLDVLLMEVSESSGDPTLIWGELLARVGSWAI